MKLSARSTLSKVAAAATAGRVRAADSGIFRGWAVEVPSVTGTSDNPALLGTG